MVPMVPVVPVVLVRMRAGRDREQVLRVLRMPVLACCCRLCRRLHRCLQAEVCHHLGLQRQRRRRATGRGARGARAALPGAAANVGALQLAQQRSQRPAHARAGRCRGGRRLGDARSVRAPRRRLRWKSRLAELVRRRCATAELLSRHIVCEGNGAPASGPLAAAPQVSTTVTNFAGRLQLLSVAAAWPYRGG